MNKTISLVFFLMFFFQLKSYSTGKKTVFVFKHSDKILKKGLLRILLFTPYIAGKDFEGYPLQIFKVSDSIYKCIVPEQLSPFRVSISSTNSAIAQFQRNDPIVCFPGDSVVFDFLNYKSNRPLSITGSRASLYAFQYNFKRFVESQIVFTPELVDSLVNEAYSKIDSLEINNDQGCNEVLKNDILGFYLNESLMVNFGIIWDFLYGTNDPSKLDRIRQLFDVAKQYVRSKISQKNQLIIASPNIIETLYRLALTESVMNCNQGSYNITDLYELLKHEYRGSFREILLTYFFLMDHQKYTSGIHYMKYSGMLKESYSLIKNGYYREILKKYISHSTYMSPVPKINLPADSSDRRFDIASLKGKVVLLDFWGYQCGGCFKFAQVFHDSVYSKLRGDTNFAVVSVMLEPSGQIGYDLYLKRLRNEGDVNLEGGVIYTFPDYINLYCGKGEEVIGKELVNYYSICNYPYVILIGKDGKLLSSTMGIFDSKDSPNVQKMYNLILDALK